ncbi:MAG: DUF998 domain-containing protein [Thermoplasmata archaeon]
MTRLGLLVRREAHVGGLLLMVGSLQFVAAMIVTQLDYPHYSDLANYVSDLGNPLLSPRAALFNGSIEILGVLGLLGALLIRSAFLPGTTAFLGRWALATTSVFAALVGVYPENSAELGGRIHGLVSDGTFLTAGFALLLLGTTMLGDPRWEVYGFYSLTSGLVTFLAIGLFVLNTNPTVYGLIERIVIAPILLWSIIGGLHVARLPGYVRSPLRPRAAPR